METGKLAIRNIQIQFDCGHTVEANDSQEEYDEYLDFEDDAKCPYCIMSKCARVIDKL